jgi:transcriptional regulator with XRE-family HTH domain
VDTPNLPFFRLAAERGWTRDELARRTGLSVVMIDKLKAGTKLPGRRTIEGVLAAFPEYSYADLFGRPSRDVAA